MNVNSTWYAVLASQAFEYLAHSLIRPAFTSASLVESLRWRAAVLEAQYASGYVLIASP